MKDLPEPVGEFAYTCFDTSLPALDSRNHDPEVAPVAIVGGGPVGLALALGLADQGVRSVVLEADHSVCIGSRAVCVSRRSLQIVDRLGALPAFLAKGLPWTVGRSFYKSSEVFRFEMPDDPREKLPAMINIQQYYIEQYLLDAINRVNARNSGCIDLRWGNELVGFARDDKGVDLLVRAGETDYTMFARWLAACDGGQSFVRKSLGLELNGAAYEGRYVIVDIELASSAVTERRAWFDPPWHPGSTILMHKQPDNIWRIDYQLRPGETPEEALQPEMIKAFVDRHLDAIGEGAREWKPVWSSVYRAGAMTLDSYCHGRVLFAGNAAHAMPIFGVRGLNSGFDDADNLAWKLALVERGLANNLLLDSYSSERIAAFQVNAENAMRSTEFMSPPSRGFDLMREAALSLALASRDIAKLINPRQTQAIAYPDTPLSSPSDDLGSGPVPGTLMPDLPLQSGHLSDHLTHGFNLLELRPDGAPAIRVSTLRALGLAVNHLIVSSPSVADGDAVVGSELFRELGADAGATYLLRPDGHVAARWRRPTIEAIQAALARAVCLRGELQ